MHLVKNDWEGELIKCVSVLVWWIIGLSMIQLFRIEQR